MMIVPAIRGEAHYRGDQVELGDVDPKGSFVHVFEETSLDVLMAELDTITDFTDYLAKKEGFLRSGRLISAAVEEELVAEFMIRMNAHGEHDFAKPDGSGWGENDCVAYGSGGYEALIRNPQYIAKKEADRVSYAWDRLIIQFTDHILAGTSLVPDGTNTEQVDLHRPNQRGL